MLTQAGHEVEVFDKTPDVGGVWSRTRRYPGLTTQSPKAQYSFSDLPMPKEFPEWPTGAQVQEYLAAYATAKGLDPLLRLSTTVTDATPRSEGGWRLGVQPEGRRDDRRGLRPAGRRQRRLLRAGDAGVRRRGGVRAPRAAG